MQGTPLIETINIPVSFMWDFPLPCWVSNRGRIAYVNHEISTTIAPLFKYVFCLNKCPPPLDLKNIKIRSTHKGGPGVLVTPLLCEITVLCAYNSLTGGQNA